MRQSTHGCSAAPKATPIPRMPARHTDMHATDRRNGICVIHSTGEMKHRSSDPAAPPDAAAREHPSAPSERPRAQLFYTVACIAPSERSREGCSEALPPIAWRGGKGRPRACAPSERPRAP